MVVENSFTSLGDLLPLQIYNGPSYLMRILRWILIDPWDSAALFETAETAAGSNRTAVPYPLLVRFSNVKMKMLLLNNDDFRTVRQRSEGHGSDFC